MAEDTERKRYLEYIKYLTTDREIKAIFKSFSEKDNSDTDMALRQALKECNTVHINPVDFCLYVVMHDIATYALNHKLDKLLEMNSKGFFSKGGHFEYFLEPLNLIPESFSSQDRSYMQTYIDEALKHVEEQTFSHTASIKPRGSNPIRFEEKSHGFDKKNYAGKKNAKSTSGVLFKHSSESLKNLNEMPDEIPGKPNQSKSKNSNKKEIP